jgi:hypothetical protein
MSKQSAGEALAAETIALQMLAFLASDGDRINRFMGAAGATPATLRASAAEPQFLAGVMDYLLADQSLLLAFAESAGLTPQRLMAARRHLPGATDP